MSSRPCWPADTITDRARSFYAVHVGSDGLKGECDRMVGDDIAEEGIKHLRETNFKDGALQAVSIVAE